MFSVTFPCFNDFQVLLRGNTAPSGEYNVWTFDQGDYFFYVGDGNDNLTLDEPASATTSISVGSYVSRNSWPSILGSRRTPTHLSWALSAASAATGPRWTAAMGSTSLLPARRSDRRSLQWRQKASITGDCPAGRT